MSRSLIFWVFFCTMSSVNLWSAYGNMFDHIREQYLYGQIKIDWVCWNNLPFYSVKDDGHGPFVKQTFRECLGFDEIFWMSCFFFRRVKGHDGFILISFVFKIYYFKIVYNCLLVIRCFKLHSQWDVKNSICWLVNELS